MHLFFLDQWGAAYEQENTKKMSCLEKGRLNE